MHGGGRGRADRRHDPDREDRAQHDPAAEAVRDGGADHLAAHANARDAREDLADALLELGTELRVRHDRRLDGRDHHAAHLVDEPREEDEPARGVHVCVCVLLVRARRVTLSETRLQAKNLQPSRQTARDPARVSRVLARPSRLEPEVRPEEGRRRARESSGAPPSPRQMATRRATSEAAGEYISGPDTAEATARGRRARRRRRLAHLPVVRDGGRRGDGSKAIVTRVKAPTLLCAASSAVATLATRARSARSRRRAAATAAARRGARRAPLRASALRLVYANARAHARLRAHERGVLARERVVRRDGQGGRAHLVGRARAAVAWARRRRAGRADARRDAVVRHRRGRRALVEAGETASHLGALPVRARLERVLLRARAHDEEARAATARAYADALDDTPFHHARGSGSAACSRRRSRARAPSARGARARARGAAAGDAAASSRALALQRRVLRDLQKTSRATWCSRACACAHTVLNALRRVVIICFARRSAAHLTGGARRRTRAGGRARRGRRGRRAAAARRSRSRGSTLLAAANARRGLGRAEPEARGRRRERGACPARRLVDRRRRRSRRGALCPTLCVDVRRGTASLGAAMCLHRQPSPACWPVRGHLTWPLSRRARGSMAWCRLDDRRTSSTGGGAAGRRARPAAAAAQRPRSRSRRPRGRWRGAPA